MTELENQLKNTQDALDEAKKKADAAGIDAANKLSVLEKQVADLTAGLNAAKQEAETLKASAAANVAKTVIKTDKKRYIVKKGGKVTIKASASNVKGKKLTYKSANKK